MAAKEQEVVRNLTQLDREALEAYWMPFTGEPPVQGQPASDLRRRRLPLHHHRRTPRSGRTVGSVVLRRRPQSSGNRRRGRASAAHPRLRAGVSVRASARVRAREQDQVADARGSRLRLLYQLRIGSGGHVAEDRARVLAREGPADEDAADRAREGLPRRQLRRHLGRRHRREPQTLRRGRRRPITCRTRCCRRTSSRAACRRKARSSPTNWKS